MREKAIREIQEFMLFFCGAAGQRQLPSFQYVDSSMSASTPLAGSQSIHRAIGALKRVSRHMPIGLRVVDLANEMNLERPTAHRILKALVAEGMLIQRPGTRRYALRPVLFEMGLASTQPFNVREACAPILERLARSTGDAAFIFVRHNNDAICLSRVHGSFRIQTPVVPIGSRQPLGVSAGGLALLSCLSETELDEVLQAVDPRLGIYGNLDATEMVDHYNRARECGYAWISNCAMPGISGLGLPVLGSDGMPIAAITVATTQARMTNPHLAEILPLLTAAARDASAALDPCVGT
jgi:DNA-binding IclR family transcriptional regulator